MRNYLSKLGKTVIYHFTDKRNIESIKSKGGLLPRSMLTDAFIPGGNQWSIDADNMYGMQNYVHLCFLNKHPMEFLAKEEGRIDPIWLEIDICILGIPDILYCAGVANQAGAVYLNNKQAIETLDFDYMYNYHDFSVEENRNRHNFTQKYEILVPSLIPLTNIRGI
jgi:hypothetical protein